MLSCEEIKKCCELIGDEYGYNYAPGIGLIYNGDDNIIYPFYRDFLQLVIEAISISEIASFSFDYEEDSFGICVFDSPYQEMITFRERLESNSITEAKEQAISYVLSKI